jgi:uncharacterized protein (DUF1015 family)
VELRPFRSLRYSRATIRERDLSSLIAPPDAAEPGPDAAPENVARLTSAADPAAAAATLKEWVAAGILEKERRPGLWTYRQTFLLDGRPVVRDALVGLVRLGARDKGSLFDPFEPPKSEGRDRRLALLSALRADFTPSFVITRAPLAGRLATTRRPELTATDSSGSRHDAFRITDYAEHVELQGIVKNVEAILADGEERFEAAHAFSKDPDSAKLPGAKYKLCAIVDAESPGLAVRPVHRLVSGLTDWNPGQVLYAATDFFETRPFDSALQALGALDALSRLQPGFVVVAPPERPTLFALRDRPEALPWPTDRSEAWRGLDVAALEVAFFSRLLGISPEALGRGEHVSHETDAAGALAAVDGGRAQAAVLMRPVTVFEIETVVHAGDRLPPRSAIFHPEVFAGLFGVALEDPVY